MPHPLSYFDPDNYQALWQKKTERVLTYFDDFDLPQPDIFPSADHAFRMRTEFRIWHEGEQCSYVVFDSDAPKTPIFIQQFPIASAAIQRCMQPLLAHINQHSVLRERLFQIEFLSTTTNELLVTLIYHKPLCDQWQAKAQALETFLQASIIGRSRKQRVVLSNDHVIEQLSVNGCKYRYVQPENAFSQPNAGVNKLMIEWACRQVKKTGRGDLLELYCGSGNFTLPLANHLEKILATEISKTGIRAATESCRLNAINNIEVVRLSSEETGAALSRQRAFRRLAHIDLDSYQFELLFVDPPRAGLDANTEQFSQQFPAILYISCNPVTLAKNLTALCQTHRIESFALFDQFPYTDHCECAVFLQKIC